MHSTKKPFCEFVHKLVMHQVYKNQTISFRTTNLLYLSIIVCWLTLLLWSIRSKKFIIYIFLVLRITPIMFACSPRKNISRTYFSTILYVQNQSPKAVGPNQSPSVFPTLILQKTNHVTILCLLIVRMFWTSHYYDYIICYKP